MSTETVEIEKREIIFFRFVERRGYEGQAIARHALDRPQFSTKQNFQTHSLGTIPQSYRKR
jgi:hypothetical protein